MKITLHGNLAWSFFMVLHSWAKWRPPVFSIGQHFLGEVQQKDEVERKGEWERNFPLLKNLFMCFHVCLMNDGFKLL